MQAIHKKTGSRHKLEIVADVAKLTNVETGQIRRVSTTLLEKVYTISNDEPTIQVSDPQVEVLVQEIIFEANYKDPAIVVRSDNKIRLDFSSITPKEPKVSKTIKPAKTSPTGALMDLKAICLELGLDPGRARAKLRKKGVPKPYEWDQEKSKEIKKILK